MSSEDESEAGAHLKKNKRTRQRVDAGEPRNSYASIPNFCSRPTLHVPPTTNGAKMLNELLATTRTNNLRCDVDFASDSTVDSTDLGLRLNGVPPTNGGGSDSSSCGGLLLDMAGPPDSPPNSDGDRSHLLREILQGKKSEASACSSLISQLLKASGPVNKSNERSNERNGSKEECNDEMAAGNELHSPEESIECNGGRGKMNGTGGGEGGGGGAQSTQSAAELKRARVETIVSGMRCSPVRDTVSSMVVNGCKKRKHYQPQQHEAVTASRLVGELEAAESPPKQRRVEREVLRKQLREIQQQLVQMQQRYFELFEAESSDSEVVGSSQSDDGGTANANAADLNNAAQEMHLKSEENDAMQPTCAADLMDPAHFIDEARRLVSEQEKLAKEAIKFPLFGRISSHNNHNHNHNNVFGGGQFTVDVEGLSEALKTEIAASLAILVDSILSRYVRRTNKSSSSLLSTSSSSLEIPKDVLAAASQMLDRRSPRTKIIDRGNMNPMPIINTSTPVSRQLNGFGSPGPFHDNPPTIKQPPPPPNANALVFPPNKSPMSLYNHHPSPPLPLSFMSDTEQNEALSLVVTPRKKRHKVTDTRITPRTVSRLLNQEPEMKNNNNSNNNNNNNNNNMSVNNNNYPLVSTTHPDNNNSSSYHPPPLVPVSLPTSVAIPNPSLHQSDVFSYPYYHHPHAGSPPDTMDDEGLMHPGAAIIHSSLLTSNRASPDHLSLAHMKNENGDGSDCNSVDVSYDNITPISSTLTPMHLRKAKLMFFFVRYPSSAILKMYFPDIKFNKNNTAQLVKWFSNFREFYYIQMEKYARQAMSEGAKCAEELSVNIDSELYRVLNLHYNRNNHIEVPVNFRFVVEQTLREFFKAIAGGKDQEQSWKKSIYKVIARMDDNLPDYFKSPNFLEQLE